MSEDKDPSKNPSTDNPIDIDLGDTDAASEAAAGPVTENAPPTPEERVALLEKEKAELKDRMLRVAADFDNWKKRSRKELADGEQRTKESVLRDILEIADNLERAIASFAGKEADAKSVREGVEMVLRQFRGKLERYQVKPIEALGQAFDPRLHEAISQAPSADAKPGSVLHELQKGYVIGDKLLRPAMVVVASAPPATEKPAEAPASEAAPAKNQGED